MDGAVAEASAWLAGNCWLVVLVVSLGLTVWYGTAPFSLFKKLGVPGPAPWPFVGNLPDFAKKGANQEHEVDIELTGKYGRVCGFFLGRLPTYLITDVELLKDILVKDFSKFRDRPEFLKVGSEVLDKGLLPISGEDWKRIRTTIAPTFSVFKMKQMVPLMQDSCETLMKKVGELADSGRSVEISSTYGKLTMEVVLTSALGVQARDIQTNPDSELHKHAQMFFDSSPSSASIAFLFPQSMGPLVTRISRLVRSVVPIPDPVTQAQAFICDTAQQMINLRRLSANSQRKDLLQLMLQAEVSDTDGKKVSKLTDLEIIAQAITFMLAGYETTRSALAFTTYCLALNPDKQEKLLQEIDQNIEDGIMPDYDTLQNLEYLDLVFSESLRLYPPAYRFGRQCNEACTINGIHFPRGVVVLIPTLALHRDSEHWVEPEKFVPERLLLAVIARRGVHLVSMHRFSPEEKQRRSPYCYLPFGAGPRNCVGMRFALLEAKMALACILKKFKFERTADTQIPLKLAATVTMAPADGIWVRILPRK